MSGIKGRSGIYTRTEEHKRKISLANKGRKMPKSFGEKISKRLFRHGESVNNSREYRAWSAMKTRCYNSKQKGYKLWGGRGIKVSSEWINDYLHFLEDMGRKPAKNYSLDRIDNNKGYSKENCRWVSRKEQNSNRRSSLIYRGKCASEWAMEIGITRQAFCQRLKNGWPYELAISTPKLRTYNRNKTLIVEPA